MTVAFVFISIGMGFSPFVRLNNVIAFSQNNDKFWLKPFLQEYFYNWAKAQPY